MNRVKLTPITRKCRFPIPFNGVATTIFVSVGDKVVEGQTLYDVKKKEVIESHYIPKLLGIRHEETNDHIARISGEYVEKGDLLAERLAAAGMIEKKVLAGGQGVISLERTNQGYIDILGEDVKVSYDSIVHGKVTGITLNSHIEIEAESAVIDFTFGHDLRYATESETSAIVGELVTIGKGDSVYTVEDLLESYDEKIVYAGRFLYPSLAEEIFARGAYAVITYSMDYDKMAGATTPIVVLGGFGQLPINKELETIMTGNVGKLLRVDPEHRKIFIANAKGIELENYPGKHDFTATLTEGDTVISNDPEYRGVTGEIVDILDDKGAKRFVLLTKTNNRLVVYGEVLDNFLCRP